LCLDLDATIVIAHSEKEWATPTWKKTFGFHPLVCFLDRPEISSGEALAGIVREGRAGSNTTADHIEVLTMALASLPEYARPKKDDPNGPRLLARADAAGATHGFAAFCRDQTVAFSFGFAIDEDVRKAIVSVEENTWVEAVEESGEVREGAWVAEVTNGPDLSMWPEGSRVIVRKERPHPGAQLSLFDEINGLRHTAFIRAERSATQRSPLGVASLELHHRQHARVEDRIRQAKATGLGRLPCKEVAENHAWLECLLAACDLVAWSKLICFADDPALARCEIDAFRYRILDMAARIIRGGRAIHLRLDRTWSWSKQLALVFARLHTAFT